MVRGINKQIIEIKCPNNECFEKILLFVKAESTNVPREVINHQSKQYYDSVMASFGRLPVYRQPRFKALSVVAAVLIAVGVILLFWLV